LIRAYEAAVLETVRQTLAEEASGAVKQ
jgi:hypothetical protein